MWAFCLSENLFGIFQNGIYFLKKSDFSLSNWKSSSRNLIYYIESVSIWIWKIGQENLRLARRFYIPGQRHSTLCYTSAIPAEVHVPTRLICVSVADGHANSWNTPTCPSPTPSWAKPVISVFLSISLTAEEVLRWFSTCVKRHANTRNIKLSQKSSNL